MKTAESFQSPEQCCCIPVRAISTWHNGCRWITANNVGISYCFPHFRQMFYSSLLNIISVFPIFLKSWIKALGKKRRQKKNFASFLAVHVCYWGKKKKNHRKTGQVFVNPGHPQKSELF